MAHSTPDRLTHQIDSLRRSFAQADGLPFADLLPAEQLRLTLAPEGTEPVYTPVVTVWMFLSQVLDADPSCAQAVARLQAWQAATAQPQAATATGGSCKARQRRDEAALHPLVQQTGQRLHQQAEPRWRWCGRPVQIIDGTTVAMPDTPANQAACPQPDGQRPGLGFPLARLGVLLCLATGAARDAAIAPYRGQGTGELALLRQVAPRSWGFTGAVQTLRAFAFGLRTGALPATPELYERLLEALAGQPGRGPPRANGTAGEEAAEEELSAAQRAAPRGAA